MITSFDQLDLSKSYTYADYLTWKFDDLVELIKGKVFHMAAPHPFHQRIVRRFSTKIDNFLANSNTCEVFTAPFDVFLTNYSLITEKEITTVVQPDVFVVCDPQKINDKGCLGSPDMIIEIQSPSTGAKDATTKRLLYEENGVKEFWLISYYERTATIFDLVNDKYVLRGIYSEEDEVEVKILKGLTIKISDIFKGIFKD